MLVSNLLVGYADFATPISTFFAQGPANRVTESISLQCDINKISGWCHKWSRSLNIRKTKTMTVSRTVLGAGLSGAVVLAPSFFGTECFGAHCFGAYKIAETHFCTQLLFAPLTTSSSFSI